SCNTIDTLSLPDALPISEAMKILSASLLLAAILPFSAHSVDDQGRLNVHSMGVKPCAKVIDDFHSDGSVAKLLNSVWVAGYLTRSEEHTSELQSREKPVC